MPNNYLEKCNAKIDNTHGIKHWYYQSFVRFKELKIRYEKRFKKGLSITFVEITHAILIVVEAIA